MAEARTSGRQAAPQRSDDGLGVRAERHARQRDADLRRGDVAGEPLGVLDDRQQPGRDRVAVLAHPPQPAAADPDRPELGGHVQPGQPDQQQDDSCGEEHPTILLGSIEGRRAGPGWASGIQTVNVVPAGLAGDLDEAARLLDDAVDAREPQTGALPRPRLGGGIQAENIVQGRGDAQPVSVTASTAKERGAPNGSSDPW